MMTKTVSFLLFFLATSATPRGGTAFSTVSTLSRTAVASRVALAEKKKIFIDGEAGTTGLQVRESLKSREDLEIVSIAHELRKDANERKKLINMADCVILCEFPYRASCQGNEMAQLSGLLTFFLFSRLSIYSIRKGLPDEASKEVIIAHECPLSFDKCTRTYSCKISSDCANRRRRPWSRLRTTEQSSLMRPQRFGLMMIGLMVFLVRDAKTC